MTIGYKMKRQVINEFCNKPIQYFENGGPRTLDVFKDISHLKINGIPVLSFIGMDGTPSFYNIYKEKEIVLSENIFSKRESEILCLMISGKTSEQISNLFYISIYTVNNHRKNILIKSGCSTINELIVKAIREGWV